MENVIVETKDRVARIEIARLDKKNALTGAMYDAMADALAAAEADAQVRAIMIHGARDCFTAGNDLKDFLERPPHGDDAPVSRFLRAIATASKPLVAAVGGPAVLWCGDPDTSRHPKHGACPWPRQPLPPKSKPS